MTLTRDFKETTQARAERDPEYRAELLKGALEDLLVGEVEMGLAQLRDYINATVGFKELASLVDKSPKTLMQMFGPQGNPAAKNFFPIIYHLAEYEGIHFELNAIRD